MSSRTQPIDPRETERVPRSVAFVAVRATGADPRCDNILEVAILLADPETLALRREVEMGPDGCLLSAERSVGVEQRKAAAAPTDQAWLLASVLCELENATVVGFDLEAHAGFLHGRYARAGMDVPWALATRIDLTGLAWSLVASHEVPSCSLEDLARHFEVDLPTPHRALDHARASLEVSRRLVQRMRLGGRLAGLAGDEAGIIDELLQRMELGRRQYGPWHVTDGRNYPTEAYAEVLDALHYVAAEMRRLRLAEERRMPRVYVCCAVGADPLAGFDTVHSIARQLIDQGLLPVVADLFLPGMLDDRQRLDKALTLRLEMVASCDELRVFGLPNTPEMHAEIECAKARRIPVRFGCEVRS